MLADEQIIEIGQKAGNKYWAKCPWLEREDLEQEGVTLALEEWLKYDPARDNEMGENFWLAYRTKMRLIDWHRRQKDRYVGRRAESSSFRVIKVRYRDYLHAVPYIDMGYWLVEEMASREQKSTPNGGSRLTIREITVLQCFADGLDTRTTAQRLDIGIETVKTYLKIIRSRLEAKNTTHAVAKAIRTGIIV